MRKGFFVFSLAMILAIGTILAFSPGRALAADKLVVWGVWDKSFYETAVKVVAEMNLADKVTRRRARPGSLLGTPCRGVQGRAVRLHDGREA
jgi:hypothetical protein